MGLVFVVLFVGTVTIVVVGVLSLLEKLPRNGIAGIRTNYTMENDERWYAVHRAAAPTMIFGGVAASAVAMAFVPFAIAGRVPDTVGGAVAIALTIFIVVIVITSAMSGVRSAKARGL